MMLRLNGNGKRVFFKFDVALYRAPDILTGTDIRDLKMQVLDLPQYKLPSTDGPERLLIIPQGIGQEGMVSEASLAEWRAENIGFIFQGFNLIPVLSAQENVELPLLLTRLSRSERRAHAAHALELVGLADRASHRPGQLSGGQEQRVAIARAIVSDPTLILADEPTGDLDRASADSVMALLARLNEELGKTVVIVTHDPLAAASAKRSVHLDKGRWKSDGEGA